MVDFIVNLFAAIADFFSLFGQTMLLISLPKEISKSKFTEVNAMGNIVGAIVLGVIAIICFVFSYLQFNEKGFLFNNAYIYASKQERKNIDKKPHYKQSGIVFLLIGIIFLINIIDIILQTIWLVYLVIGVVIVAIVYAIVSSVMIEKRKK